VILVIITYLVYLVHLTTNNLLHSSAPPCPAVIASVLLLHAPNARSSTLILQTLNFGPLTIAAGRVMPLPCWHRRTSFGSCRLSPSNWRRPRFRRRSFRLLRTGCLVAVLCIELLECLRTAARPFFEFVFSKKSALAFQGARNPRRRFGGLSCICRRCRCGIRRRVLILL
jgi:hypothetical protein